ncbi:MFS transporter [Georgenia wutianyii]|uniref:MFS transporter n=1 Tax=Georgenia wutianyii TaxID=2585135 RepID=A0ABX5VJ19_9MICO|nr:MFS transporter [Georgenia wutianyii]QDB78048.1 MFS transporter [Georgenia wutianyii]
MDENRLPWPALTAMALTVLVVVSGEMMPTAVLPALAADLDVTLASAGLLVSAWAATVVVATFPLARLTARLDRPAVIAVALVVFGLATLGTAAASTYGVAMATRLVAAAATGLLWSTVNAHAASIVPEQRIARATAVVLAGGTAGAVVAVPAGNALAGAAGWRTPFLAVGLLGLVAAVAVAVVLRRAPVLASGGAAGDAPVPSRSVRPLLALAGLGGLMLVAHFMVFTFVAELLTPSAVPTPALLLVFGLVGVLGVGAVGATSDRFPRAVPVTAALVMTLGLLGVTAVGGTAWLDLTLVLVWGLATGAIGPAVQAALMRAAGVAHRTTAGTLMPVAMNLGIALGAAAGSGAVERWTVDALPLLALVPALLAVAGFAGLGLRPRGAALATVGATATGGAARGR